MAAPALAVTSYRRRLNVATPDPGRLALERGRALLGNRVGVLERRVRDGDERAWPEYAAVLSALAALDGCQPSRLLTSAEMARVMGLSVKTLLKRKRQGNIRPAIAAGKLLRWRADKLIR
jgi:hypothetical protein